MQKQTHKKFGGTVKVMVFGIERTANTDPLENMIGIIKIDKKIDVEEIIHQKGFEDARKHLEF